MNAETLFGNLVVVFSARVRNLAEILDVMGEDYIRSEMEATREAFIMSANIAAETNMTTCANAWRLMVKNHFGKEWVQSLAGDGESNG